MVVFDCDGCGEALKKNQVQKHRMRCRNSQKLSCIDCGNDFYGQEYEKHIKCITEEEKYSGKNYKPKANANKGEQKQEQWTDQVQAAIEKIKMNSKLKEILTSLQDYPNIPRKKAKFMNFMQNSMKIFNQKLISEAWDAISAEINMNKPVETVQIEANNNNNTNNEEIHCKETLMEKNLCEIKSDKKKTKRIRDDVSETNINDDANNSNGSIQIKKNYCDNVVGNSNSNIDKPNASKKKNKNKKNISLTNERNKVHSENEASMNVDPTNIKNGKKSLNGSHHNSDKKFNVQNAIKENLKKAPDQQMPIKKLKNKIFKEYLRSSDGQSQGFTKEKFLKKIDAKLTKINKIVLSDKLATLL